MIKAFTLIEMLVVIAMLAIFASLAIPAMNPMIDLEQLRSATQQVADVTALARIRAITERRCTRVSVSGNNTLQVEILNTFDCENPDSAIVATNNKGIDGTANVWRVVSKRIVEFDKITITVTASGDSDTGNVRFRPNGRLFGVDEDLTNDGAAFNIHHDDLKTGLDFRQVGVFSQGTIELTEVGVTTTAKGSNTI